MAKWVKKVEIALCSVQPPELIFDSHALLRNSSVQYDIVDNKFGKAQASYIGFLQLGVYICK